MDWVCDCIAYVRDHQYADCAPPEAEVHDRHVAEAGEDSGPRPRGSWGEHSRQARFLLTSPDSAPVMRAKRAEVAAKGYEGFLLQ